jgi:tRNA(adenine34) deaminase
MSIDVSVASDPHPFMRAALEQARLAGQRGDVPVGAVSVFRGEILAAEGNERELRGDPTAHAEMLVLQRTAALLGEWRCSEVTLVVTLEPCPMCAGALWASRVGGVVFGAADLKAGANGSLYEIGADVRLNHTYEVRGGILVDECAELLTSYFEKLRD